MGALRFIGSSSLELAEHVLRAGDFEIAAFFDVELLHQINDFQNVRI